MIGRALVLTSALLSTIASTCHAGTTILGTVVDGGTLTSVPDTRISVEIGLTSRPNFARTDAAGRFSLVLDGWPAEDLRTERAWLSLTHPSFAGHRQLVPFSVGGSITGLEVKLSRSGGGAMRASLRDSLDRMRDVTCRTLAFAEFDLDDGGVAVDGGQLERHLMRQLERAIRTYLQERELPQELSQLNFIQLPGGVELLQENLAREAGNRLNALALLGCDLRVRPGQPSPTLRVTTKFLPIPAADSMVLSAQTVEDLLTLDPESPSTITGTAAPVWAHQSAIVLGLREAREGLRTGDRNRLLNARELLLAVQSTLPAGEGPLFRWIANALGVLGRRLGR